MRRVPIRRKRPTLRRGEPSREEKAAIRHRVYLEARGQCQLRLSPQCIAGILAEDGLDPWSHGHLVHPRSRNVHGWNQDGMKWGCWHCHLVVLHSYGKDGQKPVAITKAAARAAAELEVTVLFREISDESGDYIVAECLEIPGCVSQGATQTEAEANIKDAIETCLGRTLPDPNQV